MLVNQQLAMQAAQVISSVAAFIKEEAQAFDRNVIEYKGLNDMVSYVDREAENRLVAGLAPLLPEARFLTEEGTQGVYDRSQPPTSGTWWIIDPLDGTTNFIHGLPVYAVSVGLWHEGRPVLGVVHEVSGNEQFVAWQGGGAWLNGQRITVSPTTQLAEALVATGFPYYDFGKMQAYLKILDKLMNSCHGLRRLGSAAIDLAYVSCGRFEAFFEYNLKPWDVAAGIVLVREAGGVVSGFHDSTDPLFGAEILAAGAVHGEMRQIINQFWQ